MHKLVIILVLIVLVIAFAIFIAGSGGVETGIQHAKAHISETERKQDQTIFVARGGLRCMHLNFNAEMLLQDSKNQIRSVRETLLAQYIKDNDLDVVFISEAWSTKETKCIVESLANRIGWDYCYTLNLSIPVVGLGYGNGFLCRPALNMHSAKAHTLQGSSYSIGNHSTWAIPFGEKYTSLAQCEIDFNQHSIVLAGTQLLGNAQGQVAHISQILPRGRDLIIFGDFNTDAKDPLLTNFVSKLGWIDTATVNGGVPDNTFCSDISSSEYNPFTLASSQFPVQNITEQDQRIDYIFHRSQNLACTNNSQVVFDKPLDGMWMSDHSGLVTIFNSNYAQPVDTSVPPPTVVNLDFLNDDYKPDHEISVGARGFTVFNHLVNKTIRCTLRESNLRVFPNHHVKIAEGCVNGFILQDLGTYHATITIGDDVQHHVTFTRV